MRFQPYHHVPGQPCCACQGAILDDDRASALVSNEDSSALAGWVGPLSTSYGEVYVKGHVEDRYTICHYPDCYACKRSPEAFPIHNECLKLFYRQYPALSRLWAKAVWDYPWQRAPQYLRATQRPINRGAAVATAMRLGLSPMTKLPLELISMIRDYSQDAVFWRFVVVTSLVRQLRAEPPVSTKVIKMPLLKIDEWSRGSAIQYARYRSRFSKVRVSLDSRGIKSIKQFEADGLDGNTDGCHSFIVDECTNVRNVFVMLKNDHLRLVLPKNHPRVKIWENPRPPQPQHCAFHGYQPVPVSRLRTIELSRVTGLTFFCKGDSIFGIHSHTPSSQSAAQAYEEARKLQKFLYWIYIPMRGVTGIGLVDRATLIVGYLSILNTCDADGDEVEFNGKLVQVVQSSWTPESAQVFCGIPSSLIYVDAVPYQGITTIGLVSQDEKGLSLPAKTIRMPASPQTFDGTQLYRPVALQREVRSSGPYATLFSVASLVDVTTMRVFYDEQGFLCRGILLTYGHGGQQAVGQCGIDVFRESTVTNPKYIYYQQTAARTRSDANKYHKGLAITVSTIEEPLLGWIRLEMKGMFKFWYHRKAIVHMEEYTGS